MTANALDAAAAKVRRRLVPFLFLLYIVAYLDRINIGFAALQMNDALGFSAEVYGLGAGIFFLSYTAFEIPSNIILARVGARRWIARIMITWGLVSAAMMFVHDARSFYTLRFLLGAAEAGFFPGIIYHLTRWVPARERARTVATLHDRAWSPPVSSAVRSRARCCRWTASAAWPGWQWMFLLEGMPATLLGFVVLGVLDDAPADARWLDRRRNARHSSRAWRAESARLGRAHRRVGRAAPPVAVGAGTRLLRGAGGPLCVRLLPAADPAGRRLTARRLQIGLLSADSLSGRCGADGRHGTTLRSHRRAAMARGDRGRGRRRRAFIATRLRRGTRRRRSSCCRSRCSGSTSMLGPFWTLATSFVHGVGAAAGIALINSVGNIGGFVGPFGIGYLRDDERVLGRIAGDRAGGDRRRRAGADGPAGAGTIPSKLTQILRRISARPVTVRGICVAFPVSCQAHRQAAGAVLPLGVTATGGRL